MPRGIRPVTVAQETEGYQMKKAVSLEAWFYVSSLKASSRLVKTLLKTRFMSVRPSHLVMSVQIIRPNDRNGRIAVIARTGSQRVPIEFLKFFHDEMALFAQQHQCFFGGTEVVGTVGKGEYSEYRRQTKELGLGQVLRVH